MMKMKKGFTLIELLVVIAIIGILAAMILVSLNTARVKAKNARVKSDMAQIRTSIVSYTDAVPNMTGAQCRTANLAFASTLTTDLGSQGGTFACSADGAGTWVITATVTAGGTGGGGAGSMCFDSTGAAGRGSTGIADSAGNACDTNTATF